MRYHCGPEDDECPDCHGTGYDFGDGGQCDTCNGTGELDDCNPDDYW